jgi:hypothetical protein
MIETGSHSSAWHHYTLIESQKFNKLSAVLVHNHLILKSMSHLLFSKGVCSCVCYLICGIALSIG